MAAMSYDLRYPDVQGREWVGFTHAELAGAQRQFGKLPYWVNGVPERKRRARPKKLRSARRWANRRRRVFEEAGWRCVACGRKGVDINDWDARRENPELVPLTVDHIVPRSKGGSRSFENLQSMCRPCNGAKGNRMKEAA